MSWQHIVLIVWLSVESLAHVATIGRERKPRTPGDAIFAMVMFALILWLAVSG